MTRVTGFLTALFLIVGLTWAGKGNGGGKPGGGGPPPPGTIYFYGSGLGVHTMDGDGGNVTSLPALGADEPSWLEHADGAGGSYRWFLRHENGGAHGLYAKRQDGAVETLLLSNASGIRAAVNLYDQYLRWAKDDSFVSFIGTDATGEALFVADVAFDAAGTPYLTSPPEALLREADGVLRGHDWSPAGDRFVVTLGGSGGLHVGTIDAAGGVNIAHLAGGQFPAWSPTDDRIAYLYGGWDLGVATIRADGTGYLEITATPKKNRISAISQVSWSPDGAFLAYGRHKNRGTNPDIVEARIFTVASTGGDPTDITPGEFDIAHLMAWR